MQHVYEWPDRRGPVYRLSDTAGLPLTSAERARLLPVASRRGLAWQMEPTDGVLDLASSRVLVVGYRATHDTCVFFREFSPGDPSWIVGPSGAPGGVCSVYDERPLACRAFPLKPMGRELGVCIDCPEVVDAGDTLEHTQAAYGDIVDSAHAFAREPLETLRVIQFLATARRIAPLVGPSNREALETARGWPRLDWQEFLQAEGVRA